jgi:8-oxo-dGTP diphosphatase
MPDDVPLPDSFPVPVPVPDDGGARLACILLVDPRGWLLLQERDEDAPVDPDRWGLVGGHVEPGEDFEAAVYRELAEETGIVWESGLTLWCDVELPRSPGGHPNRYQLWVASTSLTDSDITVGEGRQIVFVDPRRMTALPMAEPAARLVHEFVQSDTYRSLLVG